MQMPNGEVMRGFLISLGFHKPASSQEMPTPDEHEKLIPDGVFERGNYKTTKDFYDPNKRKVSLAIERTFDGSRVYVQSFIFSKKGVEAELRLQREDIKHMQNQNLIAIHRSNQETLEKSIQRALSRLPTANTQQKLNAMYEQLVEYAK